jgi:formate hydrogenlyase subunit 3/multisubunit Na+/H+ antiporter MnhD subunit
LGSISGAVLANNLVILLFFWELNGFMLYLMAGLDGNKAVPSATKTLIITGIGDLSFLLGITFLWLTSGTLTISDITSDPQVLSGWLPIAAYLLIMVGAFTKAGAMPMHSWIPAISTNTPVPAMAYLPAALDKLLGIYLLAQISLNLFVINPEIGFILMVVGGITILCGVLMALIQQDFRKMLAFHAVSQVGYMVMGIGTGIPVGVIGGLFHMVNNAIYKSCLFLCGGSVQRQTGRTRFSELGGLAGVMPWTFVSCLIAALAISGVPPMNGFVSKWLIYQGILERGGAAFPIFLVIAMFGSALTLASFMKLLYSMFWGGRPKDLVQVKESPRTMTIPLVFLALVCMGFGIFYHWPLDVLIRPVLGVNAQAIIPGLWQSELAVVLLIASLLAGVVIYFVGRIKNTTENEVFLGGEALNPEVYRVPGTHFYGPIKGMNGLKQAYELADRGAFDIYTYGVSAVKWASEIIYKYIDQALSDFYTEVVPAVVSLIGQILRVLNARMILTHILWALYLLGIVGMLFIPHQYDVVALTRIIACVGMIGWALLAWVEGDLKRMLVLASTSQLGFFVLGMTLSPAIALNYLATASIALIVLFLVGFYISRNLKTSKIDQMNGLAIRMPLVFIIFLLATMWLSGLPPFGSFFSKFLLGVAAGDISPFLTITITGAAILTLGYLLRPIRRFLRAA